MSELSIMLPALVAIVAGLLVVVYVILFFILYYHWKQFAFNSKASKRFLISYSAAGLLFIASMAVGGIGLFI